MNFNRFTFISFFTRFEIKTEKWSHGLVCIYLHILHNSLIIDLINLRRLILLESRKVFISQGQIEGGTGMCFQLEQQSQHQFRVFVGTNRGSFFAQMRR